MTRQVKFTPSTLNTDNFDVSVDGKNVGTLRPAKHGPGFFLKLDGKTWKGNPKARISQERDFVAQEAYAKSQKAAKQLVLDNVPAE